MSPGSPLHRRTAQPYRPLITPWSGSECGRCADPITYVVLDSEAVSVAIDRRPHRDGTIAARIIGSRMHGYRIGPSKPVLAGYTAFREHDMVCPEAPPPPHEQGSLFDDTEGEQ